jgi:transposase
VKLMPAQYVKPYVKRGKNDAADAEAICEAVTRPTMRFVAVKSPEQQSLMMLHRVRLMLSRQRTQRSNAIRAHISQFGAVAPVGRLGVDRLRRRPFWPIAQTMSFSAEEKPCRSASDAHTSLQKSISWQGCQH